MITKYKKSELVEIMSRVRVNYIDAEAKDLTPASLVAAAERAEKSDKIEQVRQAFNLFFADTPVSSIADQMIQELQKQLSSPLRSTIADTRQLELPGIRG